MANTRGCVARMTDRIESVVSVAALVSSAGLPMEEALDSRRPLHLDHHGHVLQVITGHADIFCCRC